MKVEVERMLLLEAHKVITQLIEPCQHTCTRGGECEGCKHWVDPQQIRTRLLLAAGKEEVSKA